MHHVELTHTFAELNLLCVKTVSSQRRRVLCVRVTVKGQLSLSPHVRVTG